MRHKTPNLVCTCLLLFSLSIRGTGQRLFQDRPSMDVLNRAIQYLYNYEFDRSVAAFDTIRTRYAGSVTVHLFDCLLLYWKNFPYLDSAVEKAIFTRPEALMFASYIHLRYENDIKKGLYYAERLNSLYHNNLFFKTLYIENLIQSGSYEKAIVHLDTLSRSRIPFYRLPVALFHGMLSERYYDNSTEAEYWYKKAIESTPEPNSATENYVGLASYGLPNILRKEGNTKLAGTYYKKACKLCTYISVKKESCKY